MLREIQTGEELSVWYSNALAQWFDIPTTATPTHDEKGKAVQLSATYVSVVFGAAPVLRRVKQQMPQLPKLETIIGI